MRQPIGIFDSGFGGLTVLREIEMVLPEYDILYLGDNARSPYGNRSFETVYMYTLEAVKWLFTHDCHLVVLACNTASSKALRSIQQSDLPRIAPDHRVLGVIRPVTERVGTMSTSGHIGIFATVGTVTSQSYPIEIKKYYPDVTVTQEACPMWVPLIENNEAQNDGADYFVKKHVSALCMADPEIDTIILGCTHYPLLDQKIRQFLHPEIAVISQGALVAERLADYLSRHPEIDRECSKQGTRQFYTTEKAAIFERMAGTFYGKPVSCFETKL